MRTIPSERQPMDTPQSHYDEAFMVQVDRAAVHDPESDAFATATKNLKLFSEIRTPTTEPEPTPDPVPTTVLGKVRAGAARFWDNETTRVLIKAGGAFAGVGLVTWTTVHRDHVMERNALAQANQRTV